jgi:hypothetical protein
MGEPAERTEAARLDELAAVTSEYARYSSERSGLAASAVGAFGLGVLAIMVRSLTWGRIAALWSPLVTIGLVVAGRRYYQRFGSVLAAERSRPGAAGLRRITLLLTLLFTSLAVVSTALHWEDWSAGSSSAELALLGFLATAPALPLLVDRKVGGLWDGQLVSFSLLIAQITAAGSDGLRFRVTLAFIGSVAALAGAVLVGAGVYQHAKYRRLERRLAALKGSAP